jgi:N-acetylneuraminate synthase
MFGPDVPVSLTTDELRQLAEGVRFIEKIRLNPVNKDEMAEELKSARQLFNKSVALCVALPAGTVLKSEHLTGKKPGTGIPAARISEIVGRRLHRDCTADQLLREDDLD